MVLAAWELALRAGLVSPAALAYPSEVLYALPSVLSPSGNGADVLSTLTRSLLAFLLSIPCGITCGTVIYFAGSARAPAEFALDFLRSIPATAMVPVFLILCGVGDSTKIAAGAFSSTLIICLSTVAGLRGRNATRIGVARTLEIDGFRRLLLVDLPEAASQIFLGMRTGISLALILVIVSEMLIGSNRGLGKVIADMRYTDDKGRLYAAILMSGVIGYGFNWVLAAIEKSVVHWRGAQ